MSDLTQHLVSWFDPMQLPPESLSAEEFEILFGSGEGLQHSFDLPPDLTPEQRKHIKADGTIDVDAVMDEALARLDARG